MKRLTLFAALATTLSAQEPFTYETDETLFSTGNFNEDGLTDLVVVDKLGGGFVVGYARAADNGFDWSPRHVSGFAHPSGLGVGVFDGSLGVFVITAPDENRLTGFAVPDPAMVSPLSQHLFATGPAPRSVAGFAIDGDTSTDYLVAGDYGTSGSRYYAQGLSFGDNPESFFIEASPDETLRIWPIVPQEAVAARAVFVRGETVWISGVSGTGLFSFDLSGYTASENTRLTYGHYGGVTLATAILHERGASTATAAAIRTFLGAYIWGSTSPLTFPKPLALLITVNNRLVALFTDGSAATYDFDGTTLTHRSDLPGTHDLITPIGGDAFLSTDGAGWTRWDASSATATLVPVTAGAFPAPSNVATTSNIVFTDAEPFVNPGAQPLFIGRVSDWTTAAAGTDRDWTVTSLAQSSAGLGAGSTSPFDPDADADSALINQYMPNASFHLLEPTAYGKPVSDIAISPSSGTYDLPSGVPLRGLPITISTTGTIGSPVILFRFAGTTIWQTYNAEHPPEIFTTTSIEAHAVSAAGRTPTRRASYTFANPSVLAIGSLIDADGDGLPDQWEDAFNAHDPLGDADGDGLNNLTEYQNCTDPHDATSLAPQALVLESEGLGETLRLEWSLALATAILEGSDDLQDWEPITTGITTTATRYRHDVDIVAAGRRRFYRLTQN